MAEGQYLSEENYNRVNKKIKIIALVILIVGLLAGGVLIAVGVMKTNEAERINKERETAALNESEAARAAAEERIKEIETEKTSLETEYSAKQQECDSLDMTASDWYATANQCRREADSIQTEIGKLEMEQFELKNANYTVRYDLEQPGQYAFFYVFGAFCIVAGLMISLMTFLITKRRALRAYGIQSTMPVNKEAIEQYTPTAAKAAGDVAGSVAEGIARGIRNGKNPSA